MHSLDSINKSLKELIVKSVLLRWYSKFIVILGLVSPVIFLFYFFGRLNPTATVIIFFAVAFILRLAYVRSINRRKITSFLIKKMREEKNLLVLTMYGH